MEHMTDNVSILFVRAQLKKRQLVDSPTNIYGVCCEMMLIVIGTITELTSIQLFVKEI